MSTSTCYFTRVFVFDHQVRVNVEVSRTTAIAEVRIRSQVSKVHEIYCYEIEDEMHVCKDKSSMCLMTFFPFLFLLFLSVSQDAPRVATGREVQTEKEQNKQTKKSTKCF